MKNNYSSSDPKELAYKQRKMIPPIMRPRMISVRRAAALKKRRNCREKLSAEKICATFMYKRARLNKKMQESSNAEEYLCLDHTSPVKYRLIKGDIEQVVGYGNGLLVERGIVILDNFVKFDLGYLISSSQPCYQSMYYLPLLDNTWRFIGEFQGLDDLSLRF